MREKKTEGGCSACKVRKGFIEAQKTGKMYVTPKAECKRPDLANRERCDDFEPIK